LDTDHVRLARGRHAVEWFDPTRRTTVAGESVTASGDTRFTPPFAVSAVLYLA
jgi:hypothetical protein